MDATARSLLIVGALLLLGLVADLVAQRSRWIPRVTLLLVLGIVAGPEVSGVLGAAETEWFPVAATIALAMVGFLIGGEFTTERLRDDGTTVARIAVIGAVLTSAVVVGGLALVGQSAQTALLLGGIAAATAPAATVAVVTESDRPTPLGRLLVAVVAVDDAAALVLFGVLAAFAAGLGPNGGTAGLVGDAVWEIAGGVGLGVVLGIPLAYLTGRIQPGEPTLEEALGAVLVCAGAALWLDVSVLLAAVVMGAVVANLARHHERPFHEIERIEWPFLIVFFLLAGASLEIDALGDVGLVALAYVVLRSAGKVAGGWLGVTMTGGDPLVRRWLGWGLLPQAGVALGLALEATELIPEVAETVLTVTVVTTVVFELAGPPLTRLALTRVAGD